MCWLLPRAGSTPGRLARRRVAPPTSALLIAAAATATLSCRQVTPASSEARASSTLSVGVAQAVPGSDPESAVALISDILRAAALVAMARDGHAQPALAERWDVSDDRRSWRFVLRDGLTFHDGSPITSAAIKAALLPRAGTGAPARVVPGLRGIAEVTTPSPREITIRLHEPSSLLLEALFIASLFGGANGTEAAGPFTIQSRDRGVTVLRAFRGFWRGRPEIDRVELRTYKTQRMAWSALMRGEIDFLHEVAPEAVEFVQASRDVQAFSFLRPFVFVLGFNLEHPLLRQVAVRHAIARAIDRRLLIDRALAGHGIAATDHVWPLHWAHDARVRPLPYDPRAAAEALDAAGLSLPRPVEAGDRPPSRFRLTCLVPASHPTFERLALVVQKQLAEIGIDLVLEPVPLPELGRRLASGQFEVFLFQMTAGQGLNWPYWFWHSTQGEPGYLRSGYRGADAALDAIRLARTEAALRVAVSEFQRVLRDDPPGVFLCWGQTSRAVRSRFAVPHEDNRDILRTIAEWRIARGGSNPS